MTEMIPKSRSRKVNGYVKAILALEAARRKRDARYDRCVGGWIRSAIGSSRKWRRDGGC
jgi:hypothetical protein